MTKALPVEQLAVVYLLNGCQQRFLARFLMPLQFDFCTLVKGLSVQGTPPK